MWSRSLTEHKIKEKPSQFYLSGISKVLARILHVFLKTKGTWVFYSDSSKPWCGNLKAVCDVAANDSRINRIIIFNFGTTPCKEIQTQYCDCRVPVIVKSRGRFDLFWSAVKSEVIFVTEYSKYGFPCKSINLWHGIPLKKIGLFSRSSQKGSSMTIVNNRNTKFAKKLSEHDLVISSSTHDHVVMSACFGIHPNRVINSGLPRNDWLTGAQDFPPEYKAAIEELRALCKDRALCFYAPTFRDEDRKGAVIKPEELSRLSDIVFENGMILGYRPHLTVGSSNAATEGKYIDLSAGSFPDIQILLWHASILITDYSSCALDYMLLNKPIISYAPDLTFYSRGFLYDFSSVFPGKVISDFEELTMELSQVTLPVDPKSVPSHSEYQRLIQTRKHLFHEERSPSFSSTKTVIEKALEL